MVSEEELEKYRIEGLKVRVVRDADPANDVRGIVVAWDDRHVLIRKPNRNVVKLSREYMYQPASDKRPEFPLE
ncbi:hypothetical protein ACFQWB_12135 [Paenibacillus thermoaerophilus]|jgi:RNase P/RNase MRP subunit p29|uniref:Uncharacterized protein n=1 Tax=Paenibacillus thermoaerophilus TaxID=1215385 RepID=A0ABW2V703_9BACL|nr:hypothetical protein [Paenibacillus thermoaerophilus]TMV11982.1 hypothetical protein FE781_12325 [Paenibacillus thermoaerophilus]